MSMWLILAAAVQAAAPQAATGAEVVVTGQRLESTARALADCIARGCPPDEDIRFTLAHAENQFVGGGYAAARKTLQGSVNRNQRHAKTFPVPVSDLLRANGRVNQHLGEAELFRTNSVASLVALKAGLPENDARVLAQRVEVADVDARLGRAIPALNDYRQIARDAHAAKVPVVEGYARLRQVVLLTVLTDADGGYEQDLRRAVRWFRDRPDLAAFGAAAELMSAQHKLKKGDGAEVDALIARYGRATQQPQLLFAPAALQEDSGRAYNGGSATARLAQLDYDGQWADVSFWVTPEGKVSDVTLLRPGPKLSGEWLKPVMTRIGQRRYAPLRMEKSEPGVLRVERYTLTAHVVRGTTGTRMRVRSPIPRIEMVDLTAEAATTPPKS